MYVKMFDFAWLVFEASFISHGFVVGFVLLVTGLVFWFGFKAPEEPSFKGLSVSSASKTTPKKSNKKRTQSNGEILIDSASLNKQKSKPKQTVKASSVLKDTKLLHTTERSLSSVGKQTPTSESKEGSKQSSGEKSGSKGRGKAEDDGWESVSRKEKKIKKQASDEAAKTETLKERKKRDVLENGNDNGGKSNQVILSKEPDGTKIKAAHAKNTEKSPSNGTPAKVINSKGKTLPETDAKNKSNKIGKKEVKNHSAVANHENAKASGDGGDGEDEEEDGASFNRREKQQQQQQQRSKKLPSKEVDLKPKPGRENGKNASSTTTAEKNNDGKLKANRKPTDDEAAAKCVVDENLSAMATASSEGSAATSCKKPESGDKTNAKKSTGKSNQENRKEETVTVKKVECKQSAQPIATDDAEKKAKTKAPTTKSDRVANSSTEKQSTKCTKKSVNEVATKEKSPLMPANSNEKPKLSSSKRKRQESSDKNSAEEIIDEFVDKEITTIIVTNTNYKVEEDEGEEEKENSKKSKFDKTPAKGGGRTGHGKLGNRNDGSTKVASSGKTRNQEIVNGSDKNNSKTETSPIDEVVLFIDSSWKEAKANKKKKKPIKEP